MCTTICPTYNLKAMNEDHNGGSDEISQIGNSLFWICYVFDTLEPRNSLCLAAQFYFTMAATKAICDDLKKHLDAPSVPDISRQLTELKVRGRL